MTAVPIPMSSTTTTSAVAASSVTFPDQPVDKGDVVIVITFCTVTMPTLAYSGAGGTWAKIGGEWSTTGLFVQVWRGYGFDVVTGPPTTFSKTGAPTTSHGIIVYQPDFPVPLTTPPTVTTAGPSTGSSVSPVSTSITPAVDDLVIELAVWANATASSARTDSQAAAQGAVTGAGVAATGCRCETAYRDATTTTALSRTWTITSANWVTAALRLTPNVTTATATAETTDVSSAATAVPVTRTGWVYKGRSAAADDTASNGVV